MAADEKHAAAHYMLGPLNEPTPNEETGLGASFQVLPPSKLPRDLTGQSTASSSGTNPFRRRANGSDSKSIASSHVRAVSTPISTNSSSPYRKAAFGDLNDDEQRRRSSEFPRGSDLPSKGHRRRTSSLKERYPGDPSVRPLDTLKREAKLANRSPHLQRRHMPGTDAIDQLDATGGRRKFHHSGPYDAALLARNSSFESSPVAALGRSNSEALKATPPENVKDSVQGHRPLDGVASIPPGSRDRFGRLYQYEEGDNMMIVDGGNYKRWPGVEYRPDDIKGKGEPSYTIEKALKDHEKQKKAGALQEDNYAYELVEQPRKSHDSRIEERHSLDQLQHSGESSGTVTNGHSHKLSDGVRRRVGSLRKKIAGSSS